jgi:hypothetical protein
MMETIEKFKHNEVRVVKKVFHVVRENFNGEVKWYRKLATSLF